MTDQTELVYAAQEEAELEYYEDTSLTEDQLVPFAKLVLEGYDNVPVFRLDIPDDSELAGMHEGSKNGDIRLHPKLLDKWTVAHELAHWVRPGDAHGPQFCGALIRFVRIGISPDAADLLHDTFKQFDVRVDKAWMR